jgi:hypothetical protein
MKALKKSDVLLIWAYKSPAALHIPRWSRRFGSYPTTEVGKGTCQLAKNPSTLIEVNK